MIRVQATRLNAASPGMRRNHAGRAYSRAGMTAAVLMLGLAACAEDPGPGTDPSVRAARAEFADKPFPTLNSVPEQAPPVTPLEERTRLRAALSADQAAARSAMARAGETAAATAARPVAPQPGLAVGRIDFAPGASTINDAGMAELRAAWRIAAARDQTLVMVAGADEGQALATARLAAATRALSGIGADTARVRGVQAPAGSMAPAFEIFIAPARTIR